MHELTAREKHIAAMALMTFGYRNRGELKTVAIICAKIGLKEQAGNISADDLEKTLNRGL